VPWPGGIGGDRLGVLRSSGPQPCRGAHGGRGKPRPVLPALRVRQPRRDSLLRGLQRRWGSAPGYRGERLRGVTAAYTEYDSAGKPAGRISATFDWSMHRLLLRREVRATRNGVRSSGNGPLAARREAAVRGGEMPYWRWSAVLLVAALGLLGITALLSAGTADPVSEVLPAPLAPQEDQTAPEDGESAPAQTPVASPQAGSDDGQ
jgi:hypothetical protein